MKRYVRAEEGSSNSVIYYDEAGNKLIRHWRSYEGQAVEEASTRSWRNNNPGNILIGDFARRNGSIGEAGIPLDQKEKQKKVKFAVNAEEYEALLDAMKRHEGWRTGREEYAEVKKVLGVRLSKKGTMAEFLVGGDGEKTWLSKNEAIALTEKGLLHAVVVHAKHGVFLRPEYHQTAFKHLVCS